jgi:hypothetical protein
LENALSGISDPKLPEDVIVPRVEHRNEPIREWRYDLVSFLSVVDVEEPDIAAGSSQALISLHKLANTF